MVLVIGGTDSSGGAGVSRDLRTLADCEMAGVAAVTAVTAQSNARVHAIHVVPADVLARQISSAFDANDVRAVKIGMLGSRAGVEAVARSLPSNNSIPVVLDPVLAASSGADLLDEDGRRGLRDLLLARVTLITPNIPEAAALLGESLAVDEAVAIEQAMRIRAMGALAVLIKGGHASGPECVDILVAGNGRALPLISQRYPKQLRGTGCALASAIAAALARGLPLEYACRFGKNYLSAMFASA